MSGTGISLVNPVRSAGRGTEHMISSPGGQLPGTTYPVNKKYALRATASPHANKMPEAGITLVSPVRSAGGRAGKYEEDVPI